MFILFCSISNITKVTLIALWIFIIIYPLLKTKMTYHTYWRLSPEDIGINES